MKSVNRKLLILAAIILCFGLAGAYYLLVWQPANRMKEEYDITILEERLELASSRMMRIEQMKKDIAANSGRKTGLIADYNNLENELHELYALMADTENYQITFDAPTIDASLVRRNIHLNFSVPSYSMARSILEKLQKGKYQCLLQDVALSLEINQTAGTVGVHANVTVVFYEGASEEAQMAGLAPYSSNTEAQ